MKTIFTTLLLSLLLLSQSFSQQSIERKFKDFYDPDELITLAESLPFNSAIELLSKISERTTGKRIVSTVQTDAPIGIEIENMPYDKALVFISQYNGFIFEEKEDVIIVKRRTAEDITLTADTYAPVTTREVKISAVFFEMDVAESKSRGIDWKFLLSRKGLDVDGNLFTESQSQESGEGNEQIPAGFDVGVGGDFEIGDFFGQATAMFRFFEEENIGEIIASPSVVVRDRNQGRIQVGSDFSVRTRDFAGNTVEKFFPTGTIIEVTPFVYNEENLDYVLLDILVERSSFLLNETTTEIKKTNATTQVLMLNGEETVLGGLFINEETIVRNGIPFLKDLPWWVFGIRYLTGSDETVERKKELVILIKAELVPTLKDRMNNPTADVLKEELEDQNRRIKYYQLNESQAKK